MQKTSNRKNIICTVTGIGAISAAGNDIAANFANMTSAVRSPHIAPSIFDCDFERPVFECDSSCLQLDLLPSQRTLALTYKALHEALENAKLAEKDLQNIRTGVCIGTTVACTLNDLDFYNKIKTGLSADIAPLNKYVNGFIAEAVARKLSLAGPVATIANACASGTNAIATAHAWIEAGICDIAIAGGADELNLIPYCGFNALQVMSDELCLPFDADRKGLNLGEGAGILILESLESAIKRGLSPEISLAATGGASDAYHLTGPHPEGAGLRTSLKSAMNDASVSPEEIDYINAHGTATRDNDKTEAYVFAELAKETASPIPFSSTKYYTGHTLGAAGGIEAAICVKGMREGFFPAQTLTTPDPEMQISPAAENIPYKGNAVISTSMAFGGSCSCLLFLPCDKVRKKVKSSLKKQPSIKVSGFGIIGSFGRGREDFSKAIAAQPPQIPEGTPLTIPDTACKDPALKRARRRADKLSLIMLCAAKDAVESALLPPEELAKTAIIAATGFGPHNTTFKFLDGVLEYGQEAPSPTHFSNSVHNAPSFYITSIMKITGLSVTMTGFQRPFTEALKYAETLLEFRRFKHALVVAGDETGEYMLKMSELWYKNQGEKVPNWGEGAVAFLLSETDSINGLSLPIPNEKQKSQATAVFGQTLVNDAFATAIAYIESPQS